MRNSIKNQFLLVVPSVLFLFFLFVVQGSPAFSAVDEGSVVSDQMISNQLSIQFDVTHPSSGKGDHNDSTPTTSEEITVIVDTGNGAEVSTAGITRTTDASGRIKDEVMFKAENAKETVVKAKESGQTTARIMIPDAKDEVSQVDVNIPKDAADELASGGLDLEIYTENAQLRIPNKSLEGLADDLYFRVVPIKDETEQKEVEERARVQMVLKEVTEDQNVAVVGRPMTIETNLTSRAVDIVLPLRNVTLPTVEQERQAFLADLVIFIEHSDGERVFLKPEVVEYKTGLLGLKFGIDKFSTFTILTMEDWEAFITEQEAKQSHEAYIMGYPDGTFKPKKNISRAEMAMILSRVHAAALLEGVGPITYSDVASTHWANAVINEVSSTGLMVGFPDLTFGPEKAITRAEFAAIVNRWLKLKGSVTEHFSDTKEHWAKKDISLVQQAGIVKGYVDGTYQPDKTISRAEAVTIFNRILKRGSSDWDTTSWSDVSSTHWALKEIEEASQTHLFIKNEDGIEKIIHQ